MKKVKAAILGAGFIGQAHIEAVRRLGFVDVVAIAQSNQQSAEALARKLNVPKAYGNYMDLLKDPEIEVVHNCTPNHLHFEVNRQVLLHGKHLLSEKPLTMTSEEAEELCRLAAGLKLVTGVNFNYRQYPVVQHMRAMVSDGALGDVRIVRGQYLQDWLLYDTDYNWRIEPEYGGKTRAIGDIGSHLFDLAQYVTGWNITEVLADTAIAIPRRHKPAESAQTFGSAAGGRTEPVDVKTEDYCSVLVKFDSGARGVFTVSQISAGYKNGLALSLDGAKASCSWEQEKPFELRMGYRDKPNETLLRDAGLLHSSAQPYVHYPGGHEEGWPDSLKNMMIQFYSAVLNGTAAPHSVASFEDGLRIMRIIDAVVESAQSGHWVKVKG